MSQIKFIDLFAGIGGFHLALHKLGAKCVLAVEINPQARKTYEANFKKISPHLFKENKFHEDITTIKIKDIPDFDILCAGFPCISFSNIGKRKGFTDIHGTLFFDIIRILKAKKPKAYVLENVKGLLNHDNGKTFAIIKETLTKLRYSFYYKVLFASDYGIPQLRPRIFIVGFKDKKIKFEFPKSLPLKKTMSTILNGKCTRDIGYTLRVGGRDSPIGDRRAWDWYKVNKKWIRINSIHAKAMQGFPKSFKFPVSETQAMKQLGNAVAVPVAQVVCQQLINKLT